MKTQPVQQTRNYRRFYALLGEMPGGMPTDELRETLVSEFTNARTTRVQAMTSVEFAVMLVEMETRIQSAKGKYAEYDIARKRVLKSIIAMHELNGIHANDRIAHAKGTALKCMGFTDTMIKKEGLGKLFNEIKLPALQTIYNWANRQQKLIKNGNVALAEEGMKLALMN